MLRVLKGSSSCGALDHIFMEPPAPVEAQGLTDSRSGAARGAQKPACCLQDLLHLYPPSFLQASSLRYYTCKAVCPWDRAGPRGID